MLTKKEQELLGALEPLAAKQNVEIVSVEITGSKKAPTIRVYVDTTDPDHGVSFDELASAQAWINKVMDAIDPFPGAYTLEVSSPGIDRPLRTVEHFQRFVGSVAIVKTRNAIDGRFSFTGTIVAVDEPALTLNVDEKNVVIDLDNIKRANLKGIVDFSRK